MEGSAALVNSLDERTRFAAAMETVRATPFDPRPNDPTPAGYYGALLTETEPAAQAA